jgi:hypothetical protein
MNRYRPALALAESDLLLNHRRVKQVTRTRKRVIKSRRFQRPISASSVATMRSA